MIDNYIEILLNVPLFKGVGEEELSTFLQCIKPSIKQYKRNDIITIQEQKQDVFGIILDGELSINKQGVDGDNNIVTILKKGDMFGEISLFSNNKIWFATVISQSSSKVAWFNGDKLLTTCTSACTVHNRIILNIVKIIATRAMMLNKKIEYLTIKSIRGKLIKYILEEYKKNNSLVFRADYKRQELAQYLDVSRPSLSREFARLRDEGIIEFYKETVKIVDLDRLKKQEA